MQLVLNIPDVLNIPVRLLSVACLHLLNEVIFYRILGILGISFSHIVELSFAQTLLGDEALLLF